MKWTIPVYYPFASQFAKPAVQSAEAWDHLRIDCDIEAFSIPPERERWLGQCLKPNHAAKAEAIGRLAQSEGCSSVFSVGVGAAGVEYQLKKQFPEMRVVCTEFSPRVIQRLRDVFTECDGFELFDITSQRWPYAGNTLHLLNRVDTELNDGQWREVFRNMADSKIDRVLVLASGFVTAKTLAQQLKRRLRSWFGQRLTFAGYLRTKDRFKTLWTPHYQSREIRVGDLTAFLLSKDRF